jgi:hypothetical protein
MSTPNGLADLLAIEAIKQLKARYFRYVDTKRWIELRGLFTDDATFAGLSADVAGPDEFVAWVSSLLALMTTIHMGMQPEIRVLSAERASGIWVMQDYLEWPANTRSHRGATYPGQVGIRGYGRYEEAYRRGPDGEWLISALRMVRTRIDPVFPEPPAP